MLTQPFMFVDPVQDNASVWFRNFFDAMAEKLFYAATPEYGHVRFIEIGRDHASKRADSTTEEERRLSPTNLR